MERVSRKKNFIQMMGETVRVRTGNTKRPVVGKIVSVFPDYFVVETKRKKVYKCLWENILKVF